MKIIIANWKMNPQTIDEARMLAHQIEHGILNVKREGLNVAICPPFVFLPVLRHAIHFAKLGAQNMSAEKSGPFTGEVSASQLRQFDVQYVILGHSERRALGEEDKLINRKVTAALENKLHPILCVGSETAKSDSEKTVKAKVKKQLLLGLKGLKIKTVKLTIAYEPVWAISKGFGTRGRAVSPSHAAKIIGYLKSLAPSSRVIYGGSVDAQNATGFAQEKVIEGALVGGASLKTQEFLEIIKAFERYDLSRS